MKHGAFLFAERVAAHAPCIAELGRRREEQELGRPKLSNPYQTERGAALQQLPLMCNHSIRKRTLFHAGVGEGVGHFAGRGRDAQVVHVDGDAGILLIQRKALVVQLAQAHADAALQHHAALL